MTSDRQNKSGAKKRGFTLVELLVVIAIIAMLLAVLMPALQKAKQLANRVVCASRQRQIALALMFYISDFDGYIMPYATCYDKYNIQKQWRAPDGHTYDQGGLDVDEEYWYAMLLKAQKNVGRDVLFCPSVAPSNNNQYRTMTGSNVEERGMGWTVGLRAWAIRDILGSQWRNERAPKKVSNMPRPSEFYLLADSICPTGTSTDFTRYGLNYAQMFFIADFGRTIVNNTKPGIHLRHLEKAAAVFVDGHTGFGDYKYWTELQNPNNWQSNPNTGYYMDKPGYRVYAGSMKYRWQWQTGGTYQKITQTINPTN
jgi:prepilin-type N-terminal cleavage/methylation domain-containing protein